MADEIKASPQSPGLATLARMLRAARSAGDTVTIPYLGGVGTMMLGKAPEEVTEWSYGNAPLHVPQMTRIPQFKKDRAEQLADTLFAAQAVAPVARMAPRAARELAPAAGAIAIRAAEVGGMPVGGLGVIKHKGGNWLAGSVEKPIEMLKQGYVPDYERWGEGAAGVTDQAKGEAAALNKWLETKLAKYIKNEMGTPEDPIRALAEKGVTHAEVAPVTTHTLSRLEKRRAAVGFPAEGMGVSPQARAWEAAADDIISNLPAGDRLSTSIAATEKNLRENPWLAKVPPETMTYGVYPMEFEGVTQFGHLIDELRNAVNPESGLPAHLRWKYTDLDKVTVPQAVQRVHDINTWRAEQKAIADQARANNAAAFLHKDYPDAPYKWVELKAPEALEAPEGWKTYRSATGHYGVMDKEGKIIAGVPAMESPEEAMAAAINVKGKEAVLSDALKYEGETMGHCVGGYCPDVMSGKSRIFSLRNKKTGEPHVTVEVQPYSKHDSDFVFYELEDKLGRRPTQEEWDAAMAQKEPKIVQIKGKANRAPKEEYLPFVQDFVRSGKWSDVGDIQNTGLRATRDVWNALELEKIRAAGHEVPEYLNRDEIKAIGDKVWPGQWGDTNYAQGGLVDGAEGYQAGGVVKVAKKTMRTLGDMVDEYVRKVRKIQELPESSYNVTLSRPTSAEVPGWHITTDLPKILETGAMTNRNVGNRNLQGYAPEHVGGAYFYADPRLARMKRDELLDVVETDPLYAAELPILRAQLRRANQLVPDEDVGLNIPWQQSYSEGSFATRRPVLLNQIDRIYSSDPDVTKDMIRDTIIRSRRPGYAEGGLVDGATEYNPLEVDYIYNNVMQNYSEGGLVAYGYRHGSNELKGKGYFGELPNRAGGVSTELSAEDDDLGDYPLIVPSLTRSELESLLANERPSDSTYAKARAHARRRKAEGLSPYAQKDELRLPRPAGFAEGGSVESAHLPYDEAKISSLVNALREELNA